jgi:hypothetical protein
LRSTVDALSFGFIFNGHPRSSTLFTLVFFVARFAWIQTGFTGVCIIIDVSSRGKTAFGANVTSLALDAVCIDNTTGATDVSSAVIWVDLEGIVESTNKTTCSDVILAASLTINDGQIACLT